MRNNRFQIKLQGKTLNIAVTASGGKKCDPKLATLVRQILQGKEGPCELIPVEVYEQTIAGLKSEIERNKQRHQERIDGANAEIQRLDEIIKDLHQEIEESETDRQEKWVNTQKIVGEKRELERGILNIVKMAGKE